MHFCLTLLNQRRASRSIVMLRRLRSKVDAHPGHHKRNARMFAEMCDVIWIAPFSAKPLACQFKTICAICGHYMCFTSIGDAPR